ncbi:T9SS type A sorting domain-containing protein [Flavobacterium gelidilacus]|uniref:T9SS type A sorting domain-containing protein n=1 Tax=Flavobacterium gelidilacus TaxID=206041 RepID=UPI000424B5CF|nr:T9SS type A sorting domain-containing protein [Flavobacterium gelidilacus]
MNGDKTANLVVETQEIKIYPNPAKENVTISYTLNTSTATLEIYDLAGRSISQKVLSSSTGEEQIQTSTYQAGIYIVVVKENDTILVQQKLIIE